MSDNPSSIDSIAGALCVVVVAAVALIYLSPSLTIVLWQIVPPILLVWLIVSVLRGIVKRLLD